MGGVKYLSYHNTPTCTDTSVRSDRIRASAGDIQELSQIICDDVSPPAGSTRAYLFGTFIVPQTPGWMVCQPVP